MNQQPIAWHIAFLKENQASLRNLAIGARRMLDDMCDNQLGSPYNYTCTKMPRYIDLGYSANVLAILGKTFAYHNYGEDKSNSAFINVFVEESYNHIVKQNARICANRKAAYITQRKMWLNYIINMAELYAPK
jgi:hypothetical protein